MNRYTETTKWNNPSFRKLPPSAKLFYLYLIDVCDNAGVWEIDDEHARFCIKKDLDLDEMLGELGDRIKVLPSGKWWITRFVKFQLNGKPMMPEKVPAHAKIMRCLADAGISPDNPWITGNGEREAKKLSDETGKGQGDLGLAVEELAFPARLDCREFHETWALWVSYRRERKLAVLKPTSIKAQFEEMASWGLERAIGAIRLSIRQNWQGIFEEKSNGKSNDDRTRSSRGFERSGDYSAVKEK